MRPVTLCFSGLDPSGGAGLQADIEAIAAMGGHAAVVATALTVQDSCQVYGFELVPPAFMQAQAARVLADLPVAAVKFGMLGSAEAIEAVRDSLAGHRGLPVVMDPVLAANSGGSLAMEDLRQALLRAMPDMALITPNTPELRTLAGCEDLDEGIRVLADAGARAIWLKGGHEPGEVLVNRLYEHGRLTLETRQPRLPGQFHGSGCTMASAIAAGLAAGQDLHAAIRGSERLLRRALAQADRPRADGQWLPRRIAAPAAAAQSPGASDA